MTIDCSLIQTREDLHRLLAESLGFPDWYGGNLDALHDCLGAVTGTVRLENWAAAEAVLGKYGQSARRAMAHAALENPGLELIFS